MSKIYNRFNNEGFVLLKQFIKDKSFNHACKNFKKDILSEYKRIDKDKIGGHFMGNLGIQIGNYDKIFYNFLINNEFDKLIYQITKNRLDQYDLFFGGNLNLSRSYNQHFHTDSTFENKFIIINIATESVDKSNGPLEIAIGTHRKKTPYWKFIFQRQKTKKIILSQGDILIRKSELWHRGTRNNSENARLLLGLTLKKNKKKKEINLNKNNKIKICSNFFDHNFFGKIEEIIYIRFKYIYVLLRFIKSLFRS